MSSENNFVFGKQNTIYIIIGIVVTFVGFLLMMGGGSEDPNVFNKDEMFSSRRITVAPIFVIAGFILVIFGIMKKRKV